MKTLITGFEPFGEHNLNPSQLLIQTLPDQLQDVELLKTILPVHHQKASQQLLHLIIDQEPDAVISFGLAAGRAKISLERVALNLLDYTIADNVGVTIQNQPVVEDGPAAYFSTLPLQSMLSALNNASIPAEVSLTAGAYLCNQVFYSLMHTINTRQLPILGGFIHLPALPDQAAKSKQTMPSMSFELILQAAEIIISQLESLLTTQSTNPI